MTAPTTPPPNPGLPSEAKSEILTRIRGALAQHPPERVEVDRTYRRERQEGTDVVGVFADRLADYDATVRYIRTGDMITAADDLLALAGIRRIAVPDLDRRLAWLAATGVELVVDDPPLSDTQLEDIGAVATGCALAIAETGTIVLDTGPDQGRRALTLLPDYHLCVVRADQVVGTVPEAVARLDPTRPQTWISGPSATVDIEMIRVAGVHGPRTLHVLVLG
ncbi:LUD domain-containing protein [Yinghuangia aomiensis]|uniref:LUD domain-containing protein n=1 Tax=Yinghuangia aomiensis TaxID=676205 RepID=A0ABP9H881_9ACTN